MVIVVQGGGCEPRRAIETMFEDRKRLFVDLLGWAVPVVDGRFEKDRFDGEDAVYLIALDEYGDHAGSMRLLPTTKAHILGDLFPSLCDGPVPRGPTTFEITRLCLPARYRAARRLQVRNRLIAVMVDHALRHRIEVLTGVVQDSFLGRVLAMGRRAEALGPSRRINGSLLGAFRIRIEADTPDRLAACGIHAAKACVPERTRAAA